VDVRGPAKAKLVTATIPALTPGIFPVVGGHPRLGVVGPPSPFANPSLARALQQGGCEPGFRLSARLLSPILGRRDPGSPAIKKLAAETCANEAHGGSDTADELG
jgi:hypothetical protein